jgi:hypothetical protein
MGGEEVEFLFVKAFEQGFAHDAEVFFYVRCRWGGLVFLRDKVLPTGRNGAVRRIAEALGRAPPGEMERHGEPALEGGSTEHDCSLRSGHSSLVALQRAQQ